METTPISRLFLFGAGASHGAGRTMPSSPPLAPSLYAELCTTSKLWRHMPPALATAFQSKFEDGMLQLWKYGVDNVAAGSYVAGFLHDMSRFFARFGPCRGNAYERLRDALDASGKFDGSAFATLNYECLLEECLRPRTLNYFDYAPSSGETATCWKLHGSCTFVPKSELQVFGIALPIHQPLELVLKVIDREQVDAYCDSQTNHPSAFLSPFVPSMAVFALQKPIPFQPKQVIALQKYWQDAVAAAQVIVIVGVRPVVEDAHIWDCLGKTNATVLAVGGPGDKNVFDGWAESTRPGKPYRYLGDSFSANIDEIVASI